MNSDWSNKTIRHALGGLRIDLVHAYLVCVDEWVEVPEYDIIQPKTSLSIVLLSSS